MIKSENPLIRSNQDDPFNNEQQVDNQHNLSFQDMAANNDDEPQRSIEEEKI